MITVFLGAGFSSLGGVPLAGGLFDKEPEVDGVTRQRLVTRVLGRWDAWRKKHRGSPEEYLAYLQNSGSREWLDAVWYVSLVIALKMGRVEDVGIRRTITRHNVDRTTSVPKHEEFWSCIFRKTKSVSVLTTNYDILAERGLRNAPRPRVPRPGFHYGDGREHLAGGGYPSYTHIRKITVTGSVPLLKLHGSVSWSYQKGKLIHYHDCRPAVRGDAAILAPVTEKKMPQYLQPVWAKARTALSQAPIWIFVGYSLPEYDHLVLKLLRDSSGHQPEIYVFDPESSVAERYSHLLGSKVVANPGLPDGMRMLKEIAERAARM